MTVSTRLADQRGGHAEGGGHYVAPDKLAAFPLIGEDAARRTANARVTRIVLRSTVAGIGRREKGRDAKTG